MKTDNMNKTKKSTALSTDLMEKVYEITDLIESATLCKLGMDDDQLCVKHTEKLAEVRRLLALGANPSICGKLHHGETETSHTNAIILAAANGAAQCLRELLASPRAKLDVFDDDHETALMVAAACGELECLGILVAAGADVNLCDKHGDNALRFAMRRSSFYPPSRSSCAILAPLTELGGFSIGSKNQIEVSGGQAISVHPEVHALIAALIEAKALELDLPEDGRLPAKNTRL